ncbi:MAG: complex I NDUFA9 subunit family protein [Oceanicaulis sp.]|uniref:complex I NDUFA9 subunit family protein n=1 Tax=Glycocaulis sp. TaxID=1969725 RepID=UPI0025C6863D|nr:complex I NDUFA9 subunit family protein [Glycocaulis sp.]MCC5982086.1 complex I NDUFA9 subunit family protein [Oceanicaulis sp.]MCH8521828.1 complex I NDUFA9 subunit family protein [Glycocaulis sp.]
MLRDEMITVFGGSGFIGRYAVRALVKAGYRVRVATRLPHIAHELKPIGSVGQIQLVQANVRNAASVARAVEGASGVVNLTGILAESGRQTFRSIQAQGAANIAEAAKAAGITRLVHVSAIGADANSKSGYARTKAEGEAAMRQAVPTATILRPSIVFGAEDSFFNRFAQMALYAPALPLIGGGKTRFQPVWAGDVGEAVRAALESDAARGETYELGGPGTYSFRELMEYMLATIQRPRFLVPVPWFAAYAIGFAGEIAGAIPFVPTVLTRDQVTLLKSDNVVSEGARTLADLGIEGDTVEAIVPTYLYRFRRGGQFAAAE